MTNEPTLQATEEQLLYANLLGKGMLISLVSKSLTAERRLLFLVRKRKRVARAYFYAGAAAHTLAAFHITFIFISTGIGFNGAGSLTQAALLATVSHLQAVGLGGQKTLGKGHGANAAPGARFPDKSYADGKGSGESPHHNKNRTNGTGVAISQEESGGE